MSDDAAAALQAALLARRRCEAAVAPALALAARLRTALADGLPGRIVDDALDAASQNGIVSNRPHV